MKELIAAAVQFNVSVGDVEINVVKVEAALRRVAEQGARLAVLPEMWSCGYDYRRLSELAAQTAHVLDWLKRLCDELGLVTVGSLPELVDDTIYNTAYVVDGAEVIASYRKLHLFSAMSEDRYLAAGDRSLVVDSSVGRLGIAICYDLRFPELFRKMALDGAEVVCLPAEWPKPRQEHWRTLLRARAIENQLFVIAANCCAVQGRLDFCGLSQLVSPLGDVLDIATENQDVEIVARLDFSEMETYRNEIRILDDRRADIYGTP